MTIWKNGQYYDDLLTISPLNWRKTHHIWTRSNCYLSTCSYSSAIAVAKSVHLVQFVALPPPYCPKLAHALSLYYQMIQDEIRNKCRGDIRNGEDFLESLRKLRGCRCCFVFYVVFHSVLVSSVTTLLKCKLSRLICDKKKTQIQNALEYTVK